MTDQKQKILVIEDEADISEVIAYNLGKEGYQVTIVADGERGVAAALADPPDLALLDLMLPGCDGLSVCRRIRQNNKTAATPIIMLTARGEESEIVAGLEAGADDYVTKPFSIKELTSRVRAVLRRSASPVAASPKGKEAPLWRGDLVIDHERHSATLQGSELPLTLTEFRLLAHLAQSPGRVYTRDQLINAARDEETHVFDRTIDVHIRGIRKKLGEMSHLIETVRGVGYRFAE